MPTYVYECKTCEKVFEVEQRMVDDALTDCDCGAKGALRRIIQPVAIAFKGSGFYVNDSSGASSASTASKPAETEAPKTESPKEACGPSCACAPNDPPAN